jgi:hypothetical protein
MTNSMIDEMIIIDGPGDTRVRPADPEQVRQILEKCGGLESWDCLNSAGDGWPVDSANEA